MKQLKAFICILLLNIRGSSIISVYFIVILKALRKSLESRICHTTSEDITDRDAPGIVMVVSPPFSILFDVPNLVPCCMYLCLHIPRYIQVFFMFFIVSVYP